jgi:3-dehydroquinate synthase class II
LNEQQKAKVAELVSAARSVEEAKMVYETLQKTMAGIQSNAPQSLSEAVTKRSSNALPKRVQHTIVGRRSQEQRQNNLKGEKNVCT